MSIDRRPTERLIIFTRYPELGRTKTRMIPLLGAQGAADLQRAMTGHTVLQARSWAAARGGEVEVHYAGGTSRLFKRWLGSELRYVRQSSGDLGARMASASALALRNGSGRVVIIGCDCPGLDRSVLDKAFRAFEDHDVVLGPAADGGYYLIGLSSPQPQLFQGISWGGEEVFAQTQEAARRRGLKTAVLGVLEDVDRPEDLPAWERLNPCNKAAATISVIIPTLNEEACLADSIKSLFPEVDEVIVSDGGSTDGTREAAERAGARVVLAPRGRASQMNAGALAARGSVLLFLHADTHLTGGFRPVLLAALTGRTQAGAFTLSIRGSDPSMREVAWGANLRSRLLALPYGDQALFMKRATFAQLGGYETIPIMEDAHLIWRLRRLGSITILPLLAQTSARRWRTRGVLMTTLMNQVVLVGDRLGVPLPKLARIYTK